MKVLLINPTINTIRFPQGLLYLASALKNNGHDVVIHDESCFKDEFRSIRQLISYSEIKIIGISVYSNPTSIERAEYLSKLLKANYKDAYVIWGGWHPTVFPEFCVNFEFLDLIVIGPGEKIICEIADKVKKGEDITKSSQYLIEGSKILENRDRIDSEEIFPKLQFDTLELEKYFNKDPLEEKVLHYTFSRGCNYRCNFCCTGHHYKGGLIQKNKVEIFEDLKLLTSKYEIKNLYITDDHAFLNSNQCQTICSIIKNVGKKLSWSCACRVDTINRLSDEDFRKLKETGFNGFAVGIESGSDDVLTKMNKKINQAQVLTALNKMKKHDLKNNLFFFILNFPGETIDDQIKTIKLIGKIRRMFPYSAIGVYLCSPVTPYIIEKLKLNENNNGVFSDIIKKYYKSVLPFYIGKLSFDVFCFYVFASMQSNKNILRMKYRSLAKIIHWLAFYRVSKSFFGLPIEYRLYKFFIKEEDHYLTHASFNHIVNT